MTQGPYTLPSKSFTNALTSYSPGVPIFGATGVYLSLQNDTSDGGTAAEWIDSIDIVLDPAATALASTSLQANGILASTGLPTSVLFSFDDVKVKNIDQAKMGYVSFVSNPGGIYTPVRSIWRWLYLKVTKSTGAATCRLKVAAYVETPGDTATIQTIDGSYVGAWV